MTIRSALHLLGLWAFAIAEPLYEVLSRNREFFVAHRATPAVVIAFVLLLSFVVPAVLILVVMAADRLSHRLGRVILLTAFAALIAGLVSEVLAKSATWAAVPHVALAVAVGAVAAWAYATQPAVQSFVSIVSVGAIAFPALFLGGESMRPFVHPEDRTASAAATLGPTRPPIVFVVFDQLPLTSIMEDDDTIDESHYPGFAALAADSTWYRNATTVAELTNWAIPPLLSGERPREDTIPSVQDYPENLFTFLGKGYRYEVEEPITDLCPYRLCDAHLALLPVRLTEMLLDSSVVVLHLMAPAELEARLPSLTQDWRNFLKEQAFVPRWVGRRDNDRRIGPREWLEGISASDPQPTLYYLHALLPHEPYIYLRNGQRVPDENRMPGLLQSGDWGRDPWPVTQVYQRHLLQVQYVDWLLGEIVDRLKHEGLWDRALVIVTADHGVSFRPGEPYKEIDDATLPDIMAVPLFVKRPGQHGATTDDRNVQSIDVVPTLADLLGVALPWAPDGHSALAAPSAAEKRIQFRLTKESRTVATDDLARLRRSAVHRKLTLFDPSDPDLVPRISLHGELIGKRLNDVTIAAANSPTVDIYHPERFREFDPEGPNVESRIEGTVRDDKGHPQSAELAIAVNGVIRATTRTYAGDEWYDGTWRAFIHPRHFTKGANAVEVFVIRQLRGSLILQRHMS